MGGKTLPSHPTPKQAVERRQVRGPRLAPVFEMIERAWKNAPGGWTRCLGCPLIRDQPNRRKTLGNCVTCTSGTGFGPGRCLAESMCDPKMENLPVPGRVLGRYRNSSIPVPPRRKCVESEHLSPGGGTNRSPHNLAKIWHFGAGPRPRFANPFDSGRTPRAVPELGSGEGGWNKAPKS